MKAISKVKFDTSRLTATLLADLERSILELPEATPENFDELYDIALRAIASGGDLYLLSTSLAAMDIKGLTDHRAAEISTHLWFRAKETMDRERHADLGITQARWMYSNAPCMVDPGEPSPADRRRDFAHKAANGTVYVIAEGLVLDGKRTWPGRERGCRCLSRPLIPGFD